MATKVDVMNGALFALGQEPVTDLTQNSIDQSNAVFKLLRFLDVARDLVLARHGWACALEYARLAPTVLAGYENWRYRYTYLIPAGGVNVWEIEGHRWFEGFGWGVHGDRWEVGSFDIDTGSRKIIRSFDGVELKVAYVKRRNWEALDVHVADAIALTAAARGCKSVTGSADKSIDDKAEQQVMLAMGIDGTQAHGQPLLGLSRPAEIRRIAAW